MFPWLCSKLCYFLHVAQTRGFDQKLIFINFYRIELR